MLRILLSLASHQFLGLIALVVAVGGYADAATGGNFILGRLNDANATTTLQKTGSGAALSLKVKQGEPPLVVNSSGLVENLNADQLNGHSDDDFAAADDVYTKDESDARFALKNAQLARTIRVAYQDGEIPAASAVVKVFAKCPVGSRLISGGAEIVGSATAYLVTTKATVLNGTDAWYAVAVNPPGIHFAGTLDVQAICTLKGKPLVP